MKFSDHSNQNQIALSVVATLRNTELVKLNMLQFKTFIIRFVLN